MSAAEEINDLVVESAEREMLWQALRERQIAAERRYSSGPKDGEVDFAILCALGTLGINLRDATPARIRERRGWHYLSFPESDVAADLGGVMLGIEQAISGLGGPLQ